MKFLPPCIISGKIANFQTVNQDQYAHITDQELLGKYYAERNNYWLGLLLQRYTMLLFGVCMKYLKNEEEARDGVQQVFLKVIQELPKYKVDYFKSWLYMVAKNYCLMKLRSKNGKTTEIKETMVATPAEDSSMQNHLEKDRQLELMSESLDELSKEQKLCVTLFYLDKKSYQEIAGQTGFSMMQVKSYIQNGKRNLKINMEKKLKH
ncbi:RNA polymerase sigma factor [Pseudobacter ginsenosidimutans]|uniref:RNA polymerase sigma-70 factor (ECF subfamily) n=1 Tax=Pseudobacter ginsenosidimutans TaxID=661488 RepID=A0A4Q7MCP6_9BACT|nr:sigma-70 family RNA polymerase sigma factor [Pseudobacter ginsenosidimutans]QEC42748.1 sigma-70 family RNA polymerase sigma factor [Pseudobacter ginsenosidimutans]RZS65093.1 RNA polymerase sigma-70 factor (ECF subfamily) [Pseudobacter ginsenosidimutans]